MKERLTFICGVYNEEKRIESLMRHACQWADHVVVIDKSSTDRTREIAASFPGVLVVQVPYLPAGSDDPGYYLSFAPSDWVFIGTASEIPTRPLIDKVKATIDAQGAEIDIIQIPRKMYSFGVNSQDSPWDISYYPFCLNRKTAIVQNVIHQTVVPSSPERMRMIPYEENVCVYHLTHVTAKAYLNTMTQYFEAEAAASVDPLGDLDRCFEAMADWEEKLRQAGPELFGAYCSWPLYHLGKALFLWEKARGADIPAYYRDLKESLIRTQWEGQPLPPPPPPTQLDYARKVPLGKKLKTPWPVRLVRAIRHRVATAPGVRQVKESLQGRKQADGK